MSQPLIVIFILSLNIYKISSEDGKYILNSPKCKIPNLNPFNDELKDIMENEDSISCTNQNLLTYITKTKNTSATLHLREDLIFRSTSKSLHCCYSYVSRNGTQYDPDEGFSLTKCTFFRKKVALKHDIVKVTCKLYDLETESYRLVYKNVHHPVVINKTIKKKLKKHESISKPISVLFVVVDSLSRLNFMRTMKRSYDFLKQNNFIEMKGYTKVADNTFPNFMAFLTGFNLTTANKICPSTELDGLDHCPMIWYDFRRKDYITAYAEDYSPISTFNLFKKGFTNPPTDYYFKPYVEATETLHIDWYYDMPYCTGPERSGERILNLAKDFAVTFRNQSTFGIFWMNTFSHDDVNAPYSMDDRMKQFFIDIKKEGVLDESIVFFLSDHGIRFGKITETLTGWFEERMPVNMISIPKSFQKRFPQEYQSLKNNSNKLTNAYDLFMTLQHILVLSGVNHEVRPSLACPGCVSLFQRISSDRSCEDAAIPPEWCTCMGHFQKIDKDHDLVKNTVMIALSKIQEELTEFNYLNCQNYTLNSVLSSSISESIRIDPNVRYLIVLFKTVPPTTFLVTVKFQKIVTQNSTFFIRRFNKSDFCIWFNLYK